MKKLIMLLGMMIILTGCSKEIKVETSPWSDRQIERMQNEEIETVPVGIFRF